MSFLSILGKVVSTALGIEHTIAPIAGLIPGAGPIFGVVDTIVTRVQAAIATIEANNPASGQGQIKAAAVTADFEASLQVAQAAALAAGKVLIWDKAEFQSAINDQVSAYNHFAAVKASFKLVDAPKP